MREGDEEKRAIEKETRNNRWIVERKCLKSLVCVSRRDYGKTEIW